MLSKVYYCLFICLRPPGPSVTHGVVTGFIPVMIVLNIQVAVLTTLAVYGVEVRGAMSKVIMIVSILVGVSISLYYYVWNGHGEAVVRKLEGTMDRRRASFIGISIICETVMIPLLVAVAIRNIY